MKNSNKRKTSLYKNNNNIPMSIINKKSKNKTKLTILINLKNSRKLKKNLKIFKKLRKMCRILSKKARKTKI